MLSEYCILLLRFPEPKMETIASAYYPNISSRLPLPLHQKVVPLQSNYQRELGYRPYKNRIFSKYIYLVIPNKQQ